jgi:tRNA dimethylallyltransferase
MNKIIALAGPTAVGKTKFAIKLANEFDGEIVSCDSMQLYKYMNIGSAKPTAEEMSQARHHLVDMIDPREDFSAAMYQKLAKQAIADIFSRGKLPVVSGGTGLYLNSLLYDMDFSAPPQNTQYRQELLEIAEKQGGNVLHEMLAERDPQAAAAIHPNNSRKVIRALERLKEGEGRLRPFSSIRKETEDYGVLLIALTRNRPELYDRINRRVDILVEQGLFEEVEMLMNMGLTIDNISMKGIGYKEIFEFFSGKYSREEAIDTIKKNTRHYAKKQLTWFRRYDKMNWYNISEYDNDDTAAEVISEWVRKNL